MLHMASHGITASHPLAGRCSKAAVSRVRSRWTDWEPRARLAGCEPGQPLQEAIWQLLRNLNTEFPHGPAIPLQSLSKFRSVF